MLDAAARARIRTRPRRDPYGARMTPPRRVVSLGSMPIALVAYASTHGHTAKIAERLGRALALEGFEVDTRRLPGDDEPDVRAYDLVLVGASVHAGHHQDEVADWAMRHRLALDETPSAFFSVCLTAAEDTDESRTATREYLDDFEERTGWTPARRTSFAGALQYREYSFPVRLAMRLLMSRGGHPTETSHDHDFTDWDAVDAWARSCAGLIRSPAGP
jgi:menaquinone-dependent protoporphyrinogen oxidase